MAETTCVKVQFPIPDGVVRPCYRTQYDDIICIPCFNKFYANKYEIIITLARDIYQLDEDQRNQYLQSGKDILTAAREVCAQSVDDGNADCQRDRYEENKKEMTKFYGSRPCQGPQRLNDSGRPWFICTGGPSPVQKPEAETICAHCFVTKIVGRPTESYFDIMFVPENADPAKGCNCDYSSWVARMLSG